MIKSLTVLASPEISSPLLPAGALVPSMSISGVPVKPVWLVPSMITGVVVAGSAADTLMVCTPVPGILKSIVLVAPLVALAAKRGTSLIFGQSYRSNFNTRLKAYCADAGLHSDFGHSHVLRHSAAMAVYDATQRIGAVSHFLQHRSPATAFCYLKENDGRSAQAAINAIQFSTEAA